MSAADQQLLTEVLDEFKTHERDDLMAMSVIVGRILLSEQDLEGERAAVLSTMQTLPVLLTFQVGVSPSALAWHVEQLLDGLRARDRRVLDVTSTELTMHAAYIVRASKRQSHGLLMMARLLYVLAHEER